MTEEQNRIETTKNILNSDKPVEVNSISELIDIFDLYLGERECHEKQDKGGEFEEFLREEAAEEFYQKNKDKSETDILDYNMQIEVHNSFSEWAKTYNTIVVNFTPTGELKEYLKGELFFHEEE